MTAVGYFQLHIATSFSLSAPRVEKRWGGLKRVLGGFAVGREVVLAAKPVGMSGSVPGQPLSEPLASWRVSALPSGFSQDSWRPSAV
jgi:hypothetical protein